MRHLFLVLILSSSDFFLQVVNFYSSEATLDKFYNVNVIRGNDIIYDACKKIQSRSTEGSNVRPKSQNNNWWNLSSTLDDFCPH